MHWWPDQPSILAGRDLQAGGSWLAIAKSGRFATVTNYRENRGRSSAPRSRGEFVRDFVISDKRPLAFSEQMDGDHYAGFSLLAAAGDELVYCSNRGGKPRILDPGVYGLSNASLDTPWPKLLRCREKLVDGVMMNNITLTSLLRIVADKKTAPVSDIVDCDLPFNVARTLSAPFIVTPEYGTRCSTALLVGNNGLVEISEHRFDNTGKAVGDSSFRYRIDAASVKTLHQSAS